MATLSLAAAPSPHVPPDPVHDARDLVGPTGVGQIILDGQAYTLRITRAGKLILTK
jgi:hemin uptake protein HemP